MLECILAAWSAVMVQGHIDGELSRHKGANVFVYLRLIMKTVAEISSKIPTPLIESSRKAELTPSPIRGKGSSNDGHNNQQKVITFTYNVGIT